MLCKTLLIFLLFSALFSARSQVLTGTVTDKETGDPVPFANVMIENTTKGAATNINGKYSLPVNAGSYTVVFTSLGYGKITEDITVKPGRTLVLDVSLEQTSQVLNTVIVSASKYKQRIEETTATMEVIKPKVIDNKNVISLDKAIEQVPGISIIDNEPQMRGGSGFSSGMGSRVTVLVDGMPVLRSDAGRPVWSLMPVDNIEQVEIVKGASSVVYGSSALNGAINIRTAYPKAEPVTKYKLYGGIYSRPERRYATFWEGFNPIFYGTNLSHARRIKNFDFVLGFDFFYDPGYIGPVDEEASNKLDIALPSKNRGEYEHRGRINFATRVRSEKIKGLSYGLNGNFMESRNAQTFFWMDADTNIYMSFPGALSNFNETMLYLDP
ncbi:MAG: TonB-dependent receptor, partial [Bacteroidetes bacterium]|nr:TonB-dependent receptor [Bacteroidota bacterium]